MKQQLLSLALNHSLWRYQPLSQPTHLRSASSTRLPIGPSRHEQKDGKCGGQVQCRQEKASPHCGADKKKDASCGDRKKTASAVKPSAALNQQPCVGDAIMNRPLSGAGLGFRRD
jgi:hypothetical protein